MSFVKAISLDEEAFNIWKKRFGGYSQQFSKWVCDKLKENELELMTALDKKRLIEKRRKELESEISELNNTQKNIDLEIQNEQKSEQEKLEDLNIQQKEKDRHSLQLHKKKALELFNITDQETEEVCIKYLNEKRQGKVKSNFKKYIEDNGFNLI